MNDENKFLSELQEKKDSVIDEFKKVRIKNLTEEVQNKVESYAKAALPGLLSPLDAINITSEYAKNIAKAAFAIGVAMAETEQDIKIKTEEALTRKGY